jgi:EmrB/QacA subfamily drug resistance transporter
MKRDGDDPVRDPARPISPGKARLLPMVVALPLLLQNIDTTVMATALPSISRSLHVGVLDLNLAISAYLLSLALLLPVSGWLADRFGARRMFCLSIALFTAGSALCATADSLGALVAWRLVQGCGAAMMLPVGRLILLRTVPASRMVRAMVWFTVPGAVGRLAGPMLGGTMVTFASWHWIFLVNIPFGLIAIVLAWRCVDAEAARGERSVLDVRGFALLACGLLGLFGALGTVGKSIVPIPIALGLAIGGALALLGYVRHANRSPRALVDISIFSIGTYRAAILGSMPIRIAIGASPFMLPLMLQLGFGLSAMDSGMLTMATAIGALGTRVVITRAIKAVGFRKLVLCSATLSSVFYFSYGLFTPQTPHPALFLVLVCGGLCTSLAMVSLNTVGFADVDSRRMSHAVATSSVVHQLCACLGVVMGATLLALLSMRHEQQSKALLPGDFMPAYAVIGFTTLLSLVWLRRISAQDGEEMRHGDRH